MTGFLVWACDPATPARYDAEQEFLALRKVDASAAASFMVRLNIALTYGSDDIVDADQLVGGDPFYVYELRRHSLIYVIEDIEMGANVGCIGICQRDQRPLFITGDAVLRLRQLRDEK